ncbi:hypothetical protein [Oscillibacter sp.]|uniref:hypothetical protein n=1 Tax=Oscillibacter sp. TaxID=1945593 RepID=UPI0028A0913D|nr:hypothetical protein [Oscillibacter sp.]
MKRVDQKKRVETRKRKALRRTLTCLAALAVFSALHLYTFTPMQGIRYTEAQRGTGRTRAVARMLPPEGLKLGRTLFYLTANENAMLMTYVRFHPLMGWADALGATLDCSEEAKLHAALWSVSYDGASVQYVFGRVDDPEIQALSVSVEEIRQRTGEEVREELLRTDTETVRWYQKNGQRYFVIPVDNPQKTNEKLEVVTYSALGLDAEGREIAVQSVEDQKTSTYIG